VQVEYANIRQQNVQASLHEMLPGVGVNSATNNPVGKSSWADKKQGEMISKKASNTIEFFMYMYLAGVMMSEFLLIKFSF
jgi:hypothetical protein